MHPALNWEIKSVINFSHFYTLCWTKVERENYISIYVSQYRQLGHIESFFFFIARPGPNCKKYIWLLRILTLFSNKYSSQEMSLCLLLSFIWQSRLLRNQILFPLISPAGKLSKADSKAKTSSIHPTSHCGEARNKSFENHEKKLNKLHARVKIWTLWQSAIVSREPISENHTYIVFWKHQYSSIHWIIIWDEAKKLSKKSQTKPTKSSKNSKNVCCCPISSGPLLPLLQSDIKREKAAEKLENVPQSRWHCHTIFRDSLMSQPGGRFRLLLLEFWILENQNLRIKVCDTWSDCETYQTNNFWRDSDQCHRRRLNCRLYQRPRGALNLTCTQLCGR